MKRLIEKLGHGFSRLAFWRKPAASTPESPEPGPAQARAAALHSTRDGLDTSAPADLPVPRIGWFARLNQALHRRLNLAKAPLAELDQASAPEHPSSKRGNPGATNNDVPEIKPSLLARLKSTLRRSPRLEPLEADADMPQSSLGQSKAITVSGQVEPAADEEVVYVSRVQRIHAVLADKRVWIPGISVMLIAIIATMTGMLLQSGREKKQLQIELVAAQQKLKQANTVKKATLSPGAVHPAARKQAGNPVVATAGDTSASPQSGVAAGGCDVSNKDNVTQNLKNCIDSFNAIAN